jgi:hypothetical protein
MSAADVLLAWIQARIVPELSERRRNVSCTFSAVCGKKLTEVSIESLC